MKQYFTHKNITLALAALAAAAAIYAFAIGRINREELVLFLVGLGFPIRYSGDSKKPPQDESVDVDVEGGAK